MILDYCPGGDLGSIMLKMKKMKEEIVKLAYNAYNIRIFTFDRSSIDRR